ncbi:hypothetical protein RZS08_62090, partial [Arthrospira platensis SPKY1]|nr:hypothetical protein [Arthrospira platensis SPKY1]
QQGTTYYIYLTGWDNSSGNFALSVNCGGGCGNCPAPTGFGLLSSGHSHLVVGWDEVPGASAYQTRIRVPGGNWIDGGWFSGTSSVWANAAPCNTFELQVRA